ncbi:MAG: protein kinase, partial [Blastocatellia bacterium]|nr:protein kinase [Blastocatellia bacterium]
MPATNELLHNGRYRINHPVDHNGGSLFDAYDTVRDTKVIIKEVVLKTNKVMTAAQIASLRSAFDEHAKALSSMRHETLIKVEDHFTETDRQYLVLESTVGSDLATLAADAKPVELGKVITWADQILDGLNYLHNQFPPVFHKSVSPRNIKIDDAGRVKVLSVGLVDESGSYADNSGSDADLNFLPLEQLWDGLDPASQKVIANSYDDRSERILKEPADARTDIYGVGATIYRLVTGQNPVDALERSIELLDGNPDPLKAPDKLNPEVPLEISDVVMKAMEIRREMRFDSAAIMRQVLRTALVKIQEHQAQELLEQAEAASDLKRAAVIKSERTQRVVEENAEKQREAELLGQKLREAEEQRAAAEKRAAEIERLLREKEAETARLAAPATHVEALDDLLELHETPSSPSLEKTRTKVLSGDQSFTKFKNAPSDNGRTTEPAQEPVVEEMPSADLQAAAAEFNDVIEASASFEPRPAESAVEAPHTVDTDDNVDLYPEMSRSSGLPVAMIGGICAVLVVVVVGIWFMIAGSSTPPAQTAAPTADAPAPTEAAPVQQAFTPPVENNNSSEVNAVDETSASSAVPLKTATPERKPQPQAPK